MTILKLENIKKYYGSQNNITKAVNDLSLEIEEGGICSNNGSIWFRKNYAFKLHFHYR
mgnify:CR=1 FL=1